MIDGQSGEELVPGFVVEFEATGNGDFSLTARYKETPIVQGTYRNVLARTHEGRTERGMFMNKVESALESETGVSPSEVRGQLETWFDELQKKAGEEWGFDVSEEIGRVIDGTETPVEIRAGETTTWHPTVTFAGRTRELEFTAGEMVGNGAGALQEKLANHFMEIVEVGSEDWETVRTYWDEHSEVKHVVKETASDAVVDRVLDNLRGGVQPVADRGDMEFDVAAAWFDETNEAGYSDAPADAAILWVQDAFLVDQLEASGKSSEYKGQLVKDMIGRGDLYGSRTRRRWRGDRRGKFYPVDPESVGVDGTDVGASDEPNHSEVDA